MQKICAYDKCNNTFEGPNKKSYCSELCRKNKYKKLSAKACAYAQCRKVFEGTYNRIYCSDDCSGNERLRLRFKKASEVTLTGLKMCARCNKEQRTDCFRADKRRLDGLFPYCNDCTRRLHGTKKRQPPKYEPTKVGKAAYDKDRRDRLATEDPEREFMRRRAKHLWSTFRLSIESYMEMLEAQGNRCAICRGTDPKGPGVASSFAVDHDRACCPGHKSCGNCIRGLLCRSCNTGIGLLMDDTSVLRNAIAYLQANQVGQLALIG
jgi:hypothetical protein